MSRIHVNDEQTLSVIRGLIESLGGDPQTLDGRMIVGLIQTSLKLDTRFRSRGGIVLIRDLIGGIGDQLYVIEVTGTLDDPKPRIVPLPATSSAARFN